MVTTFTLIGVLIAHMIIAAWIVVKEAIREDDEDKN